MTRNGKIARLPLALREEINRRLHDGGEGKQIVQWLNSLPDVKRMMDEEFGGSAIGESNLSRWRKGGYRDWMRERASLDLAARLANDMKDLAQASGPKVSEQLAVCLGASLAAVWRESMSGKLDLDGQFRRLRELCAGVAALRRTEQRAQWLALERAKLALKAEAAQAVPIHHASELNPS